VQRQARRGLEAFAIEAATGLLRER